MAPSGSPRWEIVSLALPRSRSKSKSLLLGCLFASAEFKLDGWM